MATCPSPALLMLASIIVTAGSWLNWAIATLLSFKLLVPSTRWYWYPALTRDS